MDTADKEERAILAVLNRLEAENEAARSAGGESDPLEREALEVLGLLPLALEGEEPRPEVKARLLATIRPGAEVVPIASSAPLPAPVVAAGALRNRRLAVAAVALLCLGLAAASSWLYTSLQGERAEVLALRAAIEPGGSGAEELASLRAEMEALRSRFSHITTPGVEICRLQPRGDDRPQPAARGHLYIAPDRSYWLLTAHDLEPCGGNKIYHVWFRTPQGVVCGGTFHVAPGESIEIGSDDLPAGTDAVLITLEPSADVSEPSGPAVLYGDEREMTVL